MWFHEEIFGYHHHHQVVSIDLINLQLGFGKMISMSPSGKVSFEKGGRKLSKNPSDP